MKRGKVSTALAVVALLNMQGCETHEAHAVKMIRCALAGSGDPNIEHAVIVKSLNTTAFYMKESGMKKNREELVAMFEGVKNEILGPPGSSGKEQEARAKKILDTKFCTDYLNSLRQE
ncbi:hypothetical protein [Pseudomonas sp. EA_65y_Pfl1_P113]|uniref:hypothetical protein n=1 Tax=Pseudomonas sp. EA_65y_Pfl1_P113 TaxID=3088692 RepID=UPI0030D90B68